MKYVVWGKNDTPRLPPVIPMNEKEACHPRVCGDPERHGFPVKLGMTRSLTEVQNQGIG